MDQRSAGAGAASEAASAARAVGLVAQAAEFHRGSRVEDYGPLCALATRLCAGLASLPAAAAAGGAAAGDCAEGAADAGATRPACPLPGASPCGDVASSEGPPTLSGATVRLVAALVAGHGKGVGASAGLAALEGVARGWAPALTAAPVREALNLARSLVRPPGGGTAAAALFAPELLGAAARAVLGAGGEDSAEGLDRAPGSAVGLPAARSQRAEGLALLVEVCGVLQPGVRSRVGWCPSDKGSHTAVCLVAGCCSCIAQSGLLLSQATVTPTPVM